MREAETTVEIQKLKAEWDSAQPLASVDGKRLWDKLRLEWNYNSNHIEGNTLTYGETELLLFFGKTQGRHDFREYEEMKAHDFAVAKIREWSQDERILSEADIRSLNQICLKEPYKKRRFGPDGEPQLYEVTPGEYKQVPNSVALKAGGILEFTSPVEVPAKMQELVEWMRENWETMEISQLVASFHHRFVSIHPFDDGNGRVARLVTNYLLMKRGYVPIFILSSDKEGYLDVLERADAGNKEPFREYLRARIVVSLRLGLLAAKGEDVRQRGDMEKEIALLAREKQQEELSPPRISKRLVEMGFRNVVVPLMKETLRKAGPVLDLFDKAHFEVAGTVIAFDDLDEFPWERFESFEGPRFALTIHLALLEYNRSRSNVKTAGVKVGWSFHDGTVSLFEISTLGSEDPVIARFMPEQNLRKEDLAALSDRPLEAVVSWLKGEEL